MSIEDTNPTQIAEYALFQRGDFTLHSGEKSGIKIDCDALTDADLDTLAWMIVNRVPKFRWVEGVPTGGLRLAQALKRYQQTGGGLLIVDDVLTSGGSMEQQRAGREAVGAVLFARRQPPDWVTPLFTVTPAHIDGGESGA